MPPINEALRQIVLKQLLAGTLACAGCGADEEDDFDLNTLALYDGELFCPECLAELIVNCAECGEPVDLAWDDHEHDSDGHTVCQACHDEANAELDYYGRNGEQQACADASDTSRGC